MATDSRAIDKRCVKAQEYIDRSNASYEANVDAADRSCSSYALSVEIALKKFGVALEQFDLWRRRSGR